MAPHAWSRRKFLATGIAGSAAIAGCLTRDRDDGGTETEERPTETATDEAAETESTETETEAPDAGDDASTQDGFPPEFDEVPEERDVDTESFETIEQMGAEVPLAPIDVAYYWYRRQEARFADARYEEQYEQSHVEGAALSPAPDGGEDDPIDEWPTDDRIVCYCGCPHAMSSIRAASLINDGYENVYVIDEGFWEWMDRDYPVAGTDVEEEPALRIIEGVTGATLGGETVWATHEPSGQHEATTIADDGTFELHLRFFDVSDASPIAVETPDVRIERPLAELTDAPVEL